MLSGPYVSPAVPGRTAQEPAGFGGEKRLSETARSLTTDRMKGWSMSACESTLPRRCAGFEGGPLSLSRKRALRGLAMVVVLGPACLPLRVDSVQWCNL